MLEIKFSKSLYAMAMTGVIALGNVAEGAIEEFEAEQVAKKTKASLSVLPNVPESAEASEKSEDSEKKQKKICLVRFAEKSDSEQTDGTCLGSCSILGYGSKEDIEAQDLRSTTQKEPFYSEDPAEHKFWEKQLKKTRSHVPDVEELRSEQARQNAVIWYDLFNGDIPTEEIEKFLDEDLKDEQKKRFENLRDVRDAKFYKLIVYALRKFGIPADEIFGVSFGDLRCFCDFSSGSSLFGESEGYSYYHKSEDGSCYEFKCILSERHHIYEPMIKILASCLKNQAPIHSLEIRMLFHRRENINQFCEGLKSNRTLTELILPTTDLNGEKAERLNEALKHTKTLIKLNLKRNHLIDNQGVLAISEMLKTNTTLQELSIELSREEEIGLIAIMTALKGSGSMTVFSLSFSPATDEGVSAIEDMLKNNSSLTSFEWFNFYTSDKIMSPAQVRCIAEGLKCNSTLTSLTLDKLDHDGVDAIADALESNITITKLQHSKKKNN